MDAKKKLLITGIVLIVLIGATYAIYQKASGGLQSDRLVGDETAAHSRTEESMKAPDFTVYAENGEAFELSDLFGKPIVLNFWASWCGPCRDEMPHFNELYRERGDEINFVMVNSTDGSRETLDSARSFIKENGYSFPVYYDTDYDASTVYGVNSLPATYFIDEEGNLIAHAFGSIDRDILMEGIEMIAP